MSAHTQPRSLPKGSRLGPYELTALIGAGGMILPLMSKTSRLATREVKIVGIMAESNDVWMKQIARNLSDGLNGFLHGCRYLIHDRAPSFSNSFRDILKQNVLKTIRLPRKSPNLKSFDERWVLAVKELCVDRVIFFGERSLRQTFAETQSFYNQERPHQALENRIIQPEFKSVVTSGKIACPSRLSGMLNYDYRDAT